jgi:hypothetical protein
MAQGDGKVPINQTVRAGFAFMSSSLPVTFPAGIFVAVFAAAAQEMSGPGVAASGALAFAFVVATYAATIAYTAFLYRLALREDASGFFGMKLGVDEGRLVAVWFSISFLIALMVIVAELVLTLPVSVALTQSGVTAAQLQGDPEVVRKLIWRVVQTPSGGPFWALLILLGAIGLWVLLRLSLAQAATIGEARIMVFSTFGWTKGNVLNMFLALAPAIAPQAMIAMLAGGIAGADVVSVALRFVLAAIQITVLIPAQAGMCAFLYKGLRPPDFVPRGAR